MENRFLIPLNKNNEYLLNTINTRKSLYLYRAINHDLRLKIIQYINDNPNTIVTNIYTHLQKEQAIISLHLKILRIAKIVIATKKGKQVLYNLNHERIKQINDLAGILAE